MSENEGENEGGNEGEGDSPGLADHAGICCLFIGDPAARCQCPGDCADPDPKHQGDCYCKEHSG